ncbi:MAG: ABC transporter substrate-binding protein [Chloroflexi bacterium]|nr:ABC transporter substrate-binding protein [Chloroflexota bacterium]
MRKNANDGAGGRWPLAGRRAARGLLLVVLLLVVGCASVDPVVKIGLVGPFEGQNRAIGYDVIYSARLAVREINAAGGIGGSRVALVALDDSGDPDLAAQVAESLVLDPQVLAVIGHWDEATTAAAAPIYAAAGLPFLPGGAATDPALLSADFRAAYEAVTPFDETPGPYAGPAYAAFQRLWRALADSKERRGILDRTAVSEALSTP